MTGRLNSGAIKIACAVAGIAALIATALVGVHLPDPSGPRQTVRARVSRCLHLRLTPWASIGGCGASSGGAAHEAEASA